MSTIEPDQDVNKLIDNAIALFKRGQKGRAYKRLRQIIDDFGEGRARTILVKFYLHDGKVEEALQLAEQYIAANPEDEHAVTRLAKVLNKTGKTSEAIKLLADAGEKEIFATSLVIANSRAKILFKSEKTDEARKVARATIEMAPENSVAYIMLARSYEKSEELDMAIDVLQTAYDHLADDSTTAILLMNLYYKASDNFNAIHQARSTWRKHPDATTYTACLGIFEKIGTFGEGAKRAEQALRSFPENEHILASFGRLLGKDKRPEQAIPRLREALHLHPEYKTVKAVLARLYLAVGEADKGAGLMQPLHDEEPGNIVYAGLFAHLLANNGNFQASLHVLEGSLARKLDTYTIHILTNLARHGIGVELHRKTMQAAEQSQILNHHLARYVISDYPSKPDPEGYLAPKEQVAPRRGDEHRHRDHRENRSGANGHHFRG